MKLQAESQFLELRDALQMKAFHVFSRAVESPVYFEMDDDIARCHGHVRLSRNCCRLKCEHSL